MYLIRKGSVILVLVLVATLLVAACAPTPTPAPPEPAATEEPVATEEAPPTEEPAATEEPAVEEKPSALRVTFSWPTFIDPAVGNDYSGSTSLTNIYDTLVFPNAAGGTDPWLAESWEVSDDGLTYTFKLREGVKFHDGSELQASDVVYSFNRLQAIYYPQVGLVP
jgi:ABC-type transport system substrate-binding protein